MNSSAIKTVGYMLAGGAMVGVYATLGTPLLVLGALRTILVTPVIEEGLKFVSSKAWQRSQSEFMPVAVAIGFAVAEMIFLVVRLDQSVAGRFPAFSMHIITGIVLGLSIALYRRGWKFATPWAALAFNILMHIGYNAAVL